jgi:hypothetical protein
MADRVELMYKEARAATALVCVHLHVDPFVLLRHLSHR